MIIFALFVFLFALFVLIKDDFIFLRKNISLQSVFNTVLLSSLFGLFVSRIVYVLIHFSTTYSNPLVFFIIPYFPGLSTAGFLIGGSVGMYLLSIKNKISSGRLFDVVSICLFIAFATTQGIFVILDIVHKQNIPFFVDTILACIFFLCFFFFKRALSRPFLQEGTLAIISLSIFSVLFILSQAVLLRFRTIPKEAPYFLFFLGILFIAYLVKTFRKKSA